MDGVLFFVLWIGGAAVHTLVELYVRPAANGKAGGDTSVDGLTGRRREL